MVEEDGSLKIDMDFQDDALEEFSQLFCAINSGMLVNNMIANFQKMCHKTGRVQQGVEITEMVNSMLKERVKQIAPDFYKSCIASTGKDVPVVDPCNVFRQPASANNNNGEVR